MALVRNKKHHSFVRFLAIVLIISILNTSIFSGGAVYAQEVEVCPNHTTHNDTCGYMPGITGSECSHVHSEACGAILKDCIHEHDDSCMDGDLDSCYSHTCSIESGCICLDPDMCDHIHDKNCGYEEEVPGVDCTHSCELCSESIPGTDKTPGNNLTDNSTAGSDEPPEANTPETNTTEAETSEVNTPEADDSIIDRLIPDNLFQSESLELIKDFLSIFNPLLMLLDGPEIEEHELLEGYSFDIDVSLSDDFIDYNGTIDVIKGVRVNYGPQPEEPVEGTHYDIYDMKVDCKNKKGKIEGVPVFIKKGDGNMANGGTGKYGTADGFYTVTVPGTITQEGEYSATGLYYLYFGREGVLEKPLNSFTKPESELEWTAKLNSPVLSIKERDTKLYSVTVTFQGNTEVETFPYELESFQLYYHENGETFRKTPDITANGNSSFTLVYRGVPTTADIDSTIRFNYSMPDDRICYYSLIDYTDIDNPIILAYVEAINSSTPSGEVLAKLLYTEKTSLSGEIRWMDDGSAELRPLSEDLAQKVQVFGADDLTTPIDSTKYSVSITPDTDPDKANIYHLSISGLPAFSTNGSVNSYVYKLDNTSIPATDGTHSYTVRYNNGSVSSETQYAYSGAALYLTLSMDNPEYKVKIQWQDDEINNPNNDARKEAIGQGVTMYLWRYAGDDSGAAAVYDERGSQYSFSLNEENHLGNEQGICEIDVNSFGWDLPSYNENGRLYHYYLTAICAGGEYKVSYSGANNYVINGESIILTRIGTDNIVGDVEWKAIGEKDYVGTKTQLILQRRVAGGDWETVEKDGNTLYAQTPAVSTSVNTVKGLFSDISLYNEIGQTYEFRVLSTGLISAGSGDVIPICDIDSSSIEPWTDVEGENAANLIFKYKNHGYVAEAVYDTANKSFKVTNKLHEEINFTINTSFVYGDSFISRDSYSQILKALLTGDESSLNEERDVFTRNVSYNLYRNNQLFAKVEVTGGSISAGGVASATYSVIYEKDNEYADKDVIGLTMTQKTTVNDKGEATGENWSFTGIPLPKYDDNGNKYTYTIGGESTDTHDYTTSEHDELYNYLHSVNNVITFIEVSQEYDTQKNNASIVHRLLRSGVSYHITGVAEWEDSLTDRAKRQVEAHIMALTKGADGNYYLYKDLTESRSAAPALTPMILNNANVFRFYQYYSPIKENEIEEINATLPPERQISKESELYYTAIEVAVEYDGYTYQLPYLSDNGMISPVLINGTGEPIQMELKYDPDEPLNVLSYPYSVKNDPAKTTSGGFSQTEGSVHSHTRTFLHTLSDMKGKIHANLIWYDDNDSSRYRKNAIRIELWRATDGLATELKQNTENGVDVDVPQLITWLYVDGEYKGDLDLASQSITFPGSYPLYDSDGNPYRYSIKQYIIAENGDESLIDEEASEYNTKNNYTTIIRSEVSAVIDDGPYRQDTTFYVENSASNKSYSTEFFVVWHDEAAYKAKSRADMQYTLYYTLGNEPVNSDTLKKYDLSDYNFVIDTAEDTWIGSVLSNPYYQVVKYSGLTEFYNNQKVHYFMEQRKTDTNESDSIYDYASDFYHESYAQLVKMDGAKLGFIPLYYHRSFVGGESPSADEFIGEKEVVINSIKATIEVSGTKKWVNMPEKAARPVCTVYLFRDSDYDKKNKKPTGHLDDSKLTDANGENTYIASTGLNEPDHLSFSFADENGLIQYEKYDMFGASYNYEIGEIIKAEDGTPLPIAIMTGTSDGSQMLVNRFDPDGKNSRKIIIKKNWLDGGGNILRIPDSTSAPYAIFDVYRMTYDYKIDGIYPDADKIDYARFLREKGPINKAYLKTNAEHTANIIVREGTRNAEIEDLSIYSPEGKPYVYFIVEDDTYVPSYKVSNKGINPAIETPIAGNNTSKGISISNSIMLVSNDKVSIKQSGTANNTTAEFDNTLKEEEKFFKLAGTITWTEGDTAIRQIARPDISEANNYINFRITRTADTQKDEKNPIKAQEVYAVVPTDKISWSGDATNPNIWHYVIDDTQGSNPGTGFPLYSTNGNPYTYTIKESPTPTRNLSVNYTISPDNRSQKAEPANITDDTLTMATIPNILKGNYTVKKVWSDGYNSYGLRPAKVKIIFQYLDASGNWMALRDDSDNVKTLILSTQNQVKWRDTLTRLPIQSKDGTKNYKYRAVEVAIGYDKNGTTTWYDVVEKDFENGEYPTNHYETVEGKLQSKLTYGSYRVFPGDIDGVTLQSSPTTTVTNVLDKKTELLIRKTWEDDGDQFGVRPKSLSFVLEKREYIQTETDEVGQTVVKAVPESDSGIGSWQTVAGDPIVMTSSNATESDTDVWERSFENLPIYDEDGYTIMYRAREIEGNLSAKPDAQVGSYKGTITAQTQVNPDNPTIEITSFELSIKNTLDADIDAKTTLSVNKDWAIEGGDTTAATKGYTSEITAYAEYKIDPSDDAEIPVIKTSVVTLSSGDYTHTWNMIPEVIYDDAGNSLTLTNTYAKETAVNNEPIAYSVTSYEGKELGTATDGSGVIWLVDTNVSDDGLYTIINTPQKSHSIVVNYQGDSDANDTWSTRPDKVYLKLQYKYADEMSWKNVDATSTFAKALPDTVVYNDIEIDTAQNDSYTETISLLPEYVYDNGSLKKYDYRIIESKVSYGDSGLTAVYDSDSVAASSLNLSMINSTGSGYELDRSLAGYTYAYKDKDNLDADDNKDTTYLTKSLLKVAVTGEKIWDDESDKYSLRPAITATQQDLSTVKVDIFKASVTSGALSGIVINWDEKDTDIWEYSTDKILPKYKSGQQILESYFVKEAATGNAYTADYGTDGATYVLLDASVGLPQGAGQNYTITPITNRLKKQTLVVKKIWEKKDLADKLDIVQISATFTVFAKAGAGDYVKLSANSGDVTVTLSYDDSGVTVDDSSLTDLPVCDASGNEYSYRIVETGLEYTLNGNPVTDTYTPSGLSGNTSYSHEIGKVFNATYSHKADSNIYQYENATKTTKVGATISWVERKVNGSENDATLIEHFRPSTLNLILQRKVSTKTDSWEDVSAAYLENAAANISVTIDHENHNYSVDADSVSDGKLPLYMYDTEDDTVKAYEYRIVEKTFDYGDLGQRTLKYLNSINSDNAYCDDNSGVSGDTAVYYRGEQTTTENNGFKTTITNTLQTGTLVNEIEATLTGKISWLDNNNELNKRPDTDGITMVLRAQPSGGNNTEAEFVVGSGGDSGQNTFASKVAGKTSSIEVNWNKTSGPRGVWTYTLTGLPLYDSNGNYIIYSVCQKADVTDYENKAVATNASTGHHSDDNRKYAFGKVTDTVNNYETDGKLIENVDFTENMKTTLRVKKTWKESDTPGHFFWNTRPESLTISLYRREVSLDADGKPVEGLASEWVDINITDTISTQSSDTWVYEKVLDQYNVSGDTYKLYQYKAYEHGKNKNSSGEEDVIIDTVVTNTVGAEGAPHVGSYFMSGYKLSWDNGVSIVEIDNTLDKRDDITVEKVWNTNTVPSGDVRVNLVGFVNDKESNITTEIESFYETLNASNNWTYIYRDLPKYDLNFRSVDWELKEISVNGSVVSGSALLTHSSDTQVADKTAGISSDGKWLATYHKDIESGGSDENDEIILKVTNTSTTSASLQVSYDKDFDDGYNTRFASGKALLQVRTKADVADPGEWMDVPADLSGIIVDENNVAIENGKIVVSADNSSKSGTYSYSLTHLPEHVLGNTSVTYEYRLVEIAQGGLTPAYTDIKTTELSDLALIAESSGGYAFEYSGTIQSAALKKTLLHTHLEGKKVWVDVSNAYSTRASGQNGVQGENTPVSIAVSENNTVMSKQPEIRWSSTAGGILGLFDADKDTWVYKTEDLPKYRPGTDTLASYTVTESYRVFDSEGSSDNEAYSIDYGKSLGTTRLASVITQTDGISDVDTNNTVSTMSDITNSLKSLTMIAEKIWYNDEDSDGDGQANEPANVVIFRLSESTNDTDWSNPYPDIIISVNDQKDMLKNTGKITASWPGLPTAKPDGSPITYKISEISTRSDYQTQVKPLVKTTDPVTGAEIFTATFINIKLQSYSVYKSWENLINGIEHAGLDENDKYTYVSTVSLQKKIGTGAFADVTDSERDLVSTYDERDTLKSTTYVELPMYTVDGVGITYRGIEKKVNNKAGNVAYEITYSPDGLADTYVPDTGMSWVFGNNKTYINNRLNEVTVKVVKTDKTSGEKLKGVTFTLTAEDGTIIQSKSTGDSGEVEFDIQTLGKYVIKETRALGYTMYNDISFEIKSYHEQEKDFEVENTRKTGTLYINKTDADSGEKIDGIYFDLYKKNEGGLFENIWNFITGNTYSKISSTPAKTSGSTVIKNLEWGDYYIVETKADGYVLPDTPVQHTFSVSPLVDKADDNDTDIDVVLDITNTKNAFKFQKQSAKGDTITGGEFAVYKEGVSKAIDTFTIESGAQYKILSGYGVGEFEIREIKAPIGYDISAPVKFSVNPNGYVYKDNLFSTRWADNTIIMKDMKWESLTVTKMFADDAGVASALRPDAIKLQLYQVENGITSVVSGGAVKLPVNKASVDGRVYYTYEKLPMYNTATAADISYFVKEEALIYNGNEIKPEESLYDKNWKVQALSDVTPYEVGGIQQIDENGFRYKQEITNTLNKDALNNVFTKIENTTPGPEESQGQNESSINPGGTISVLAIGGGSAETSSSDVPYQKNSIGVTWKADENWGLPDSFTINYTGYDYSSGTPDLSKITNTITVKDYLIKEADESVKVKDKTDSCYDELKNIYPDFNISYSSANDEVRLELGTSATGLPFLNQVCVEFIPTVAIVNTTDIEGDIANLGGKVRVQGGTLGEIADGKDYTISVDTLVFDEKSRYTEITLYAEADEGYQVNLKNVQIGEVGAFDQYIEDYDEAKKNPPTPDAPDPDPNNPTPEGESPGGATSFDMLNIFEPLHVYAASGPISIDMSSGGTYSPSFEYDGKEYKLSVKATPSSSHNPKSLELTFNGLYVPIDVGVEFIKASPNPADDAGGGSGGGGAGGSKVPEQNEEENTPDNITEEDEHNPTDNSPTDKPVTVDTTKKSPKTGDEHSMFYLFKLFISAFGIIHFNRRRYNEKSTNTNTQTTQLEE